MGLSNGSNNVNYLNIKEVDGVPKFQKYNGKNEAGESQYEYYSELTGYFKFIDFKDKEITYKGKTSTKREVRIGLEDEGTEYVIVSLFGGIVRGLLNMLNSKQELGELKIVLYRSKSGYSQVYVENNGEKLEWALSRDEQKALIEAKEINGDTINDYTSLHEALETVSKNLKPIDKAQAQSDAVVEELGLEDDVF